jgi:glutamate-ammonia-ligase adenylyltransferase
VARLATAGAQLARLGFGGDALGVLERLGLPSAEGPVLDALAAGADPDAALRAVQLLAERAALTWEGLRRRALRDPEALRLLALLAGASQPLASLPVTDPGLVAVLTGRLDPHPTARAERVTALTLAHPGLPPARALARARRRGLARVAMRDLAGRAGFPAVAGELSALAEGVLRVALAAARDQAGSDAPLAVIAMGKLGAGELNYVSDVDVLFVGDTDLAGANRIAERFLRLVGAVTPEGQAYEVDANLRPEGRDGALVRNLGGYRTYYERWAATWEFQALLKARPIAGDADLGAAFVDLLTPFVWPDRRDAATVADIQRLKGVVESSRSVRRAGGREVKLAPGGLRDIEFSVQLLQLVHGRHDPALRARGTLPALAALAEGGYVGEEDAVTFADAYAFLRTVEHRLQLQRLRRTHALPADEPSRTRLARTLGYRDDAQARAVERLDADLARVRGEVRRVHEKLFYRPLLGRFAEVGRGDLVVAPDGGGLEPAAVTSRLAALGFDRPDAALRALDALTRGTGRRPRLLRTLLPTVLPTLAATPDPDAGLAALWSLAERLESPAFLAALRDRPVVAERLVTVLGASPLVGRWLERQPELLLVLVDETALAERRAADVYQRLAEGLIRRNDPEERIAEALRRVARRETARTAIRDLLGLADPGDVAEELTGLAEACLQVALTRSDAPLAIVGLGKLGGRELGYASDLDVLFVFEPADARDEALRAAASLLRLLPASSPEGRILALDPNLRPEGKDGPLARSLASYRTYYERWAEPWELQALTQARPVAGDPDLGRAFVEVLAGLVYPAVVPDQRLEAVRAMKRRVEAERPRARGTGVDLKLDPGGMTDVEWTVQLLALAHGGRLPRLRRRGTLAALGACEAEGVLTVGDAAVLREGYSLLTRLRNRAYLAGLRDPGRLPPGDDELARVSALLEPDLRDPAVLRARVTDLMVRVRAVHDRVFS